jgi:hypothetical protein
VKVLRRANWKRQEVTVASAVIHGSAGAGASGVLTG